MTTADLASLPSLCEPRLPTPEQVDAFNRNGNILLREVATPAEVQAYRAVIGGAAGRHNRETRKLEDRDAYGKAFLQITNLWQKDEAVKRFTLSPRFGAIAAALLGVPRVRLYHDQALFKEPGGGPTPWHQDQFYWPLDTDKTITMWMPLVDVSVESGALKFANGSHRTGYLGDLPISETSDQVFSDFVKQHGFEIVQVGRMTAGDATFHQGWTLHSAPGNKTLDTREVMTIIWYADGARLTPPANSSQQADLEAWYPALKPGDLADSPLTPRIDQ